MTSDNVKVDVPARSEYGLIVRVTAAAAAERAGLGIDAVADVRMIAEEAFVLALSCSPEDGRIGIDFEVTPGSLTVVVPCTEAGAAEFQDGIALALIEGLSDGFERSEDGTSLRFVRGTGAPDAD